MELKKELTPREAILDFEVKYFDGLFKHKHGKKSPKGYHACYQAIKSARENNITFERAARILYKYAPPGAYKITEKIEVEKNEANTPTFAELASEFREKHPNAFGLEEEEIETKI